MSREQLIDKHVQSFHACVTFSELVEQSSYCDEYDEYDVYDFYH